MLLRNVAITPAVRLALGAAAGCVGLLAMVRLVSSGFTNGLSPLAWAFLLLAMVPWVGYVAWRARRSRITRPYALAVLVLAGFGLLALWLSTLGEVLALVCSLAAFVLIWVHDWPDRRPRGSDHFVRIEDLAEDGD